jgi:aspartyl/glutamyl-tRNA(Asn/Gln) amidotransferase subunit A (EC 6.3.5.-)
MHTKTIAQLAQGLHTGNFSSVELTQAYLQRIQQYQSLNSFISITDVQALAAAEQADLAIAQGKAGPLTGVPIAHKDIFCTQGIKNQLRLQKCWIILSPLIMPQ